MLLWGSSVPLYLWQLILAFQFGKGVSIGAGIISGLISALTPVPASSWRKEPRASKGAVLYKFDDGSTTRSGWHEISGYPYQEYFEVFNE